MALFYGGQQSQRDNARTSTSRLHGDGYGCHAHAKSEHGEPWRYTIRGVSLAGMTSGALHARENASMPAQRKPWPTRSHWHDWFYRRQLRLFNFTGHCLVRLATNHYSPIPRPTPGPAGSGRSQTLPRWLLPATDRRIAKTERGPISTSGLSILIMHRTRRSLRKNQSVFPRSPPLDRRPFSAAEALHARGSRPACLMPIRRNACSLVALPDFPEFAQVVRYGVPGTRDSPFRIPHFLEVESVFLVFLEGGDRKCRTPPL